MRAVLLLCVAGLASCGDNVRPTTVTIVAGEPAWVPALGELARLTPGDRVALGSVHADATFSIQVVDDQAIPTEGFAIERLDARTWRVHANDLLGAQYGAAAALENLGIRYRHPTDPEIPATLAYAPTTPEGEVQRPAVRVRGIHLHTLHPIEAHFAFVELGPGSANDAHRIVDWVVKNRGNYFQWAALNFDPAQYPTWKAYTQELIAYAHLRGVRVGLDIQLFGQSNLQNAFDLSEDKTGTIPIHDEVAAKLPQVVDGLPFDVYQLTFGEFFDEAPDRFIAAVNEVQAQLAALAPRAELHGLVHDGATQRVTYMGQDLIYYFLIKFASPAIIPDIHTTMFFDMFEDAGGAYHHDDFHEHLAYLEERMCAGRPAAYHPEDAYWVAFDDSVPQWYPLYLRSRWLDLDQLRARPCWPLDEHLLFSSGFEWGYWMNDVAALRASYTLPASSEALVASVAPAGTADVVDRVIAIQHDALIGQRLAAYVASRDASMDLGRSLGIVSQPDRTTFDDLAAMPSLAAWFEPMILAPLVAYRDALAAIPAPAAGDRWRAEIADGLAIDVVRADFVIAAYRATLAHLSGDAATARARYQDAQDALARARAIVDRRHAALHDFAATSADAAVSAHGRLTSRGENYTYYQYGYLYQADTLCFWHRELDQVGAILGVSTETPPNCIL